MLKDKIFDIIIRFLKQFFLILIYFIVIYKHYDYYFEMMYSLKFDFFVEISLFEEFFYFLILTLYLRFLLFSIFKFNGNPLFFYTIKIYSIYSNLKILGFKNFIKNIFFLISIKFNKLLKKYWKFRYNFNPFRYNLFYKVISIFDKEDEKKVEEEDKKKKQKHEEWRKKYKTTTKITHEEHIKRRNSKTRIFTIKKETLKKKPKKKPDVFFYKTKKTKKKLFKRLNEKYLKLINIRVLPFNRLINLINKKPINSFSKMFINIIRIFFLFIDIITTFLFYFFLIFPMIVWKPINIRNPYFKKIKNKK